MFSVPFRLAVRAKQLENFWTDFHKIWFCQSACFGCSRKNWRNLYMTLYANFCSTLFLCIYGRVIKSDKITVSISEEATAAKISQWAESIRGPGSVVSIATSYGLDDPVIESRWRVRFSALVQTGLGAHPASCTMGTGSFPGVESGRSVTLTPQPLLVPWS
jgi:hypothetical protein